MAAPVTLVKGDEPILRDAEVTRVVDALFDDFAASSGAQVERVFALEDFTVESGRRSADADDRADHGDSDDGVAETPQFRAILTALQSPPFVTPMRVVVIRDIGGLNAEQGTLLAEYVAAPLEGVFLVLAGGNGRTPAALEKALKAAKVPTVAPEKSSTADVLQQYLQEAGIGLDASARSAVAARLGDDAGRVPEFVALLASTFGAGARLDLESIEHYLGERGRVAPYLLTNAIDQGDTATALEILDRLLHATSAKDKPMHALQVMGMLTKHVEQMVRIDAPDVRSERDAAAVLGIKDYPAKLRLQAARRLGTRGITQAVGYLAQADLDLRGGLDGGRALPPDTVMELLVVRLCAQAQRSGSGPSGRSGGSRRR